MMIFRMTTIKRCQLAATLPDIDRGLAKVATIIEMYGDDYWPIFERLEMEREKLVGRAERLAAAKARIRPDRATNSES